MTFVTTRQKQSWQVEEKNLKNYQYGYGADDDRLQYFYDGSLKCKNVFEKTCHDGVE